MPVSVAVEKVSTFSEHLDGKIVPGGLPPCLNEDKLLYGTLENALDLTIGYQELDDSAPQKSKLNSLINYIRKISNKGSPIKTIIDAEFVTTPRILNALGRSIYNISPLEIQAVRMNDVIFIYDRISESTDSSIPYLHKFRQYMTLRKNGNPNGNHDKISSGDSFCVINRLTLKSESAVEDLKVFYASNVDAIDKDGNFIEIKTTAGSHKKWLEKQSLRHYFQSFFANSPYIVYGRRTNFQEQTISKVDKVRRDDISKDRVIWNKEKCFDQLFKVLIKIKSELEYDEQFITVNVTGEDVFCENEDIDFRSVHDFEYFDFSLLKHFE